MFSASEEQNPSFVEMMSMIAPHVGAAPEPNFPAPGMGGATTGVAGSASTIGFDTGKLMTEVGVSGGGSVPPLPMTAEGTKNDDGKPRYDLIPAMPMERVAEVYTIGAAKYGDRNWEKGMAYGRLFRAMLSHAWKWWRGEKFDKEDGQHHLASVAFCALGLMQLEETHPEKDDRP